MPADFLHRIDDHETAFAPIGSLAGTEDMVLIAAAKNGSSPAFEVLVERHARRIRRAAQRVTGNREDAEDAVQQSFRKAFVHLRDFEGRSSFSTWLTRVAINEGLMLRRRTQRLREVSIEDSNSNEESASALEIPDSSLNPEASYSQQERGLVLTLAMNKLPPGIRKAIQLRFVDELSTRDTARIMGLSISAVKARVFHGRQKLRELLKRHVKSAWMSAKDGSRTIGNTRHLSQDQVACSVRS